ncbi:MAG: L-iditol 2-dehydrogenase [Promethearchaeota archaeon]|nr:MAG: L-iditol 2-dehydrogenase [Candidatus Lokiarchaeota archaeon]
MKAAFYYDTNDFRVEEINLNQGSDDLIVEVKSVGICGTDVHKAVNKTVHPPIVLGHEVCGKVISRGSNVTKFQPGDRVALAHHASCRVCKLCLKGHDSLCDQYLRTNLDPGGFATHVRVPRENIQNTTLKIVDSITYEEGAFMEPLSCCLRGLKRLAMCPGDSALVIGSGPIGLIFVQLLRAFNSGTIFISDFVEYRLHQARENGASYAINLKKEDMKEYIMDKTDNQGVDVIINTVGISSAYQQGLEVISKGGHYLFFAETYDSGTINLDPNLIYSKELDFVGSYSSSPDYYQMGLDLIQHNQIDVKKLISHRFKLDEIAKAIQLAHEASESLKIMINP